MPPFRRRRHIPVDRPDIITYLPDLIGFEFLFNAQEKRVIKEGFDTAELFD
jgi:hypothetical protein